MKDNEYLWRFTFDYGRMGSLFGLFIATEEDIAQAIGKQVDFGEVLGKHSQVDGELEQGDFNKLDVTVEAVQEVSKHLGKTWSGYNPLEYIQVFTTCEQCQETMNEDDWYVTYRDEFLKDMCIECYEEKLEEEDNEEEDE